MTMAKRIEPNENDSSSDSEAGSEQSSAPVRVLVAASGSGGHLIPALHIIDALKSIQPSAVVECIGVGRPLEEKILGKHGLKRHIISSTAIKQRGVAGLLRFVVNLPKCVWQCIRLFRQFKPDVVVGVGGYASVMPVVVARFMRIPSWAHEAELRPGLANTVLGYFASTISISFEQTKIRGGANLEFTGHPVRPELASVERVEIRSASPQRLLVLGGSQGAEGLDRAVDEIGSFLRERDVEVVHQCRSENVDLVINSYRAAGVKASVVSFIEDMAGAYDWADVIISRAGASSVAEIGCVNKPTLFVPYPYQQGTHQSDNAQCLVSAGKAVVVEELLANFGERLLTGLKEIFDEERYRTMKQASFEPRGLGASKTIALGILRLVKRELP